MFECFQAVIYPKEIIRNTKKNSTINFSFHNKQQLEKALKAEQGLLYYFHVLESRVRFCLQKPERWLSEGECLHKPGNLSSYSSTQGSQVQLLLFYCQCCGEQGQGSTGVCWLPAQHQLQNETPFNKNKVDSDGAEHSTSFSGLCLHTQK